MADGKQPTADGATVEAAGPEDDQGGGLVLVASGDGPGGPWSYWWPAAEWDGLNVAERAKVIRRARLTHERAAAEDDRT